MLEPRLFHCSAAGLLLVLVAVACGQPLVGRKLRTDAGADAGACGAEPCDAGCPSGTRACAATGGCLTTSDCCDDADCDVSDGGDCLLPGACQADGGLRRCARPAKPDATPCPDDGNPCTDDSCAAGTCEHPPKTVPTTCDDGLPCTEDQCVDGGCVSTSTCDAGQCTDAGVCGCAVDEVLCDGQCLSHATACASTTCGLCGVDSSCNGKTVTEPATQRRGTCATDLPLCDSGAETSLWENTRYFKRVGEPRAYFWLCAKVTRIPWTAGSYQWTPWVTSMSDQGGTTAGCTEGGFYAVCDVICDARILYRAFCNGQNWVINLSSSYQFGCPNYSPLPAAINCP